MSNETKWTKAPWKLTGFVGDGAFCIEGNAGRKDGMDCVICERGPWTHRSEMSDANALLIAAAPDLYAALEDSLATLIDLSPCKCRGDFHCSTCKSVDSARAALSRARGETAP